MATIRVSSNSFTGVPFPLVLADRFFHIYEDASGALKVDVFRWSETFRQASYEVKNSRPISEGIEAGPNGVVLFSSDSGGFQYKFRPKPGKSQIFGKVPVTDELSVVLHDRSLRVYRGDVLILDASRNQVSGCLIGVQVGADGSVAMGVNSLPDGMILQRT